MQKWSVQLVAYAQQEECLWAEANLSVLLFRFSRSLQVFSINDDVIDESVDETKIDGEMMSK